MGEAETSPSVELEKVISLFTGPNSSGLHERHLAAISRLCKNNSNGFAIRDLPKVQQIVELTLQLLRSGLQQFKEPTCDLLRTLTKPFIKRTSTDEFKMLNTISSMLLPIGRLLAEDHDSQLKMCAAEMLIAFSTAHGQKPASLEFSPAKLELIDSGPTRQYFTNQSLIAKSGAVAWVVAGLSSALASKDILLTYALMAALLQFSFLPDNCVQMVEGGILSVLPDLLKHHFREDLTTQAVQLLWHVLENAPESRQPDKPEATAESINTAEDPGLSLTLRDMAGGESTTAAEPEVQDAKDPESAEVGGSELVTQVHLDQVPPSQIDPEPVPDEPGASTEPADGILAATLELGIAEAVIESQVSEPQAPSLEESTSKLDADDMLDAETTDLLEGDEAPDDSTSSPSPSYRGTDNGAVEDAPTYVQNGTEALPESDPLETTAAVPPTPAEALAFPLTALLHALLVEGNRTVDKELRNDVLIVCGLLMKSPHFRETFALTDIFAALLLVATSPELGQKREGSGTQMAWSPDSTDFELKQLAFSTIAEGCKIPAVLELALHHGFLTVLLLYADASAVVPGSRWNVEQAAMLRCSALLSIQALAVLEPHRIVEADGVGVLVRLSCNPGVAHAHHESAVRILHTLASAGPALRPALLASGVLRMVLDILQGGGTTSLSLSPSHQSLSHWAVLLATSMCCRSDEVRRLLRKAQGIGVILSLLQRQLTADHSLPSPTAIAVVNLVWTAVVPDRKSTAHFLVGGGLDSLLSLLERGHAGQRPVVLSALSDLLENHRSHTFFHEWRSAKTGRSAVQVLIGLWKEEDSARTMTVNGLLAHVARPLEGLQKRHAWPAATNSTYSNLTGRRKEELGVVERHYNGNAILAKVFAVLNVIGFRKLAGLSTEELATVQFIENYVKFRQGEAWCAIRDGFEKEGMRPTFPDRQRMASGIESAEHTAIAVQEAQAGLLGQAHDALVEVETRFFSNMTAQRILEREARFYQKDASRLTLAEMREAKAKREEMLRNSVRSFVVQDIEEDGDEEAEEAEEEGQEGNGEQDVVDLGANTDEPPPSQE